MVRFIIFWQRRFLLILVSYNFAFHMQVNLQATEKQYLNYTAYCFIDSAAQKKALKNPV